MIFRDGLGNVLHENDAIGVPFNNSIAPGKIIKLDIGLAASGQQSQPSAVITVVLNSPALPDGTIPGVLAIKTPSDVPALLP